MRHEIVRRAFEAFRADADAEPPMTLRGGNAVDSYDHAPPYDAALDEPTDAYLEAHAYWGVTYLDPASWRHYLPRLMDYALRHVGGAQSMVVEGLLWSLRPPEREPVRLASLSAAQEAVVVEFLNALAFDGGSGYRDDAMEVLREYWGPGALYRERPPGTA